MKAYINDYTDCTDFFPSYSHMIGKVVTVDEDQFKSGSEWCIVNYNGDLHPIKRCDLTEVRK